MILRSKKKLFFIACILIFWGGSNCYGQFNGGNAGGHAISNITNSICSIATINPFGGGSSSGFSSININNSVCSISTLNAFGGGDGDGYSQFGVTNSVCSVSTLNAFGGGESDGYGQIGITNSICTITTLNAFGGGGADGYAQDGITNSICTITTLNAFGGGSADGFGQIGITNSVCSISTLNAFAGGGSGGFANIQETALDYASCIALPVELISFDVKIEKDYILINWKTASEINNDYFTLEKTVDGVSYHEVTRVPGAGNSIEILNYEAIDRNPYFGISYYRLKQTDFDGQFAYSNIRSVQYNQQFNPNFEIYPNPNSSNLIHVEFNQPVCLDVKIELKDLSGKSIFKSQSIINQNLPFEIDLNTVRTKGIYLLTISCERYSSTKKVVFD